MFILQEKREGGTINCFLDKNGHNYFFDGRSYVLFVFPPSIKYGIWNVIEQSIKYDQKMNNRKRNPVF
jgi:hypothetical protein